jgi:hypothetical protein
MLADPVIGIIPALAVGLLEFFPGWYNHNSSLHYPEYNISLRPFNL